MDPSALERILNSKLPDTKDLDEFLSKIDHVSQKIDDVLKGKDVPVDEIVASYQKPNAEPIVASEIQTKDKPKTVKQLSSEQKVERIQKLKHFKNVGNEAYSQKDFEKAISEYSNGIKSIDDKPISQIESSLLVQLYSNSALCYNKSEKYQQAIEYCEKAISLDKTFSKAYLRRGNAKESLGLFQEALDDYTSALNCPNMTQKQKDEILSIMSRCKIREQSIEKQKTVHSDDITQHLTKLKKSYSANSDTKTLCEIVSTIERSNRKGMWSCFYSPLGDHLAVLAENEFVLGLCKNFTLGDNLERIAILNLLTNLLEYCPHTAETASWLLNNLDMEILRANTLVEAKFVEFLNSATAHGMLIQQC
jgi:tetratricopeptide (TPR) repeat protein